MNFCKTAALIFILTSSTVGLLAQEVYTIKADSTKLTGCDSNELIIENHTQNVKGFLFNTGNGRTIFKTALIRINDSIYLIGADTLKLPSNFWSLSGNTGTVDKVSFVGTRDNVPLNFRVNNVNAGRISSLNLALGYLAADSIPSAQRLTAFGTEAARYNAGTLAFDNTAIGYQALRTNRGPSNVAIGARALSQNRLSGNNVAIGVGALGQDTTGGSNTAVGASALAANKSGSNNVAIGASALSTFLTTGSGNVAVGRLSLNSNTGSGNTAIGDMAGSSLTTGTQNIFIGDTAGWQINSGSYNVIIGPITTGLPATLNNNIIIANGKGQRRINVDSLGNFMINTTTPAARNTFSGTGNFSDTLTATTMGNTDSSNRVATTAWVKRQGYSGIAINGILNSSLAVNGTIKAKELRLSQNGWPDYVFDSTYHLIPLNEVENYIRLHHHLPGISSAISVEKDGLSVGDMQAMLLKKIEELTLYGITQDKKLADQNKMLDMQSKLLEQMQQQINELKEQIARFKLAN